MKSRYYRDSKGQYARPLAKCVAFWHTEALGYIPRTKGSLPRRGAMTLPCSVEAPSTENSG